MIERTPQQPKKEKDRRKQTPIKQEAGKMKCANARRNDPEGVVFCPGVFIDFDLDTDIII